MLKNGLLTGAPGAAIDQVPHDVHAGAGERRAFIFLKLNSKLLPTRVGQEKYFFSSCEIIQPYAKL
jgi:hypothetical protein